MFPSSLRGALAVLAAAAALALVAPVEAEARGHKPQHWHRGGPPAFVPPGHLRHHHVRRAPVYIAPRPVYVAPPPPVYVVPAPVYVEPVPVYPHPYYAPYPRGGSASFSITIPLD